MRTPYEHLFQPLSFCGKEGDGRCREKSELSQRRSPRAFDRTNFSFFGSSFRAHPNSDHVRSRSQKEEEDAQTYPHPTQPVSTPSHPRGSSVERHSSTKSSSSSPPLGSFLLLLPLATYSRRLRWRPRSGGSGYHQLARSFFAFRIVVVWVLFVVAVETRAVDNDDGWRARLVGI